MPDASFLSSDLFLLTLTVGLYCLGGMIYRRTRLPLLHPVLLTFVAVIVFLRCAGIGYERYRDATGILNFALGMSVVVFCVGIFGSIFGEWILRRCGVRDPEARGFALGAAAHGIGTARAIEIGAAEGALSGLAMALMGLATALLMPLMEKYLY